MALILSVAGLLVLTGCGSGAKDVQIYVAKADMPRVEYVEGQELDLSDGRLTIITNGEESKLPLVSDQITVTGYDKATVGEQVLTIQYGEYTTTITVTVEARAVAENFETKYFVGDSFNKTMGKIRITTDEIKHFTVNMNDAKVSVVDFDSSVAGPATVTVLYNDGQNSYYCQFSVTVYEESNVEFSAPYKVKYNSNDAGLDVNGGFFTVTSSDSKLTKQVPLTAEMVSGFDLSAATMEDRVTPKNQTLTVEYLGKTFTYDIQITFKGPSVVTYHYENTLSKIDWQDAKLNGLSEDVSAAALDAITEYFKMTEAQRAQLSAETRSVVGRAGAIAAMSAFNTELKKYSKTISMNATGNLYFICESYEQTAADLEVLNDPDSLVNVYASLLRKIESEFGDTMLDSETAVQDLVVVYQEEIETALLEILSHMVSVHSLVADIPAEWDAEMLKAYGDKLVNAAMEIYSAGYYRNGYWDYYTKILAPWREKQDTFDILYTYFLYDYENGREFMTNYMWDSMPMPGLLEDWFRSLSTTIRYEQYFANYGAADAYLADVSPFMFYYFQTMELAESIKNSGNQLWLDIFEAYNGDYMNRYYTYNYAYGFLYHAAGMADNEAFNQLWNSYYQVLKHYDKEDLSATTHRDELVAMFDAFQALNPSELLGFLSSLNLMYSNAKGGLPMLSYSDEFTYNTFAEILRDYYQTYLNEANKPLFANLLLAMENFALISYKDSALAQFKSMMNQISVEYNALSAADRANFDMYMGVSYQKYLALYNLSNGTTSVTLTAKEQAMFGELNLVMAKYFSAYATILAMAQNNQEISSDLYVVLYGLHSNADQIYNEILLNASAGALNMLYLQNCEFLSNEMSLALAFYELDAIATSLMGSQRAMITGEDGGNMTLSVWDIYRYYGLRDVWGEISEVMYQAYFQENITLTKDELVSIMTKMRNLPDNLKRIMASMGVDMTYYRTMNTCLNRVLSEGAVESKAAAILMSVESAYNAYMLDNSFVEARDAFVQHMEQLAEAYNSLTDADKEYLSEAYSFYLDAYNQMKTAD